MQLTQSYVSCKNYFWKISKAYMKKLSFCDFLVLPVDALCTLRGQLPAFIPNFSSEVPALCTLSPLLINIFSEQRTESVKSWSLRGKIWRKKSAGS